MSINKKKYLENNIDLKDKITNLEYQLLHFFQTDLNFVEDMFGRGAIDLSYFVDDEIRETIKLILDYYKEYGNLLVKQEFESHIDSLASSGKITDSEHNNYLTTYEEAWDLDIAEDQYQRIKKAWLNAALVPHINETITERVKEFIQAGSDYKGLDFIDKIKEDLSSLYVDCEAKEKILSFDLVESSLDQIEHYKKVMSGEKEELISTGIKPLDFENGGPFLGFAPSTLNLLMSVTSGGKSTFAINVSRHIYENLDKNVLCVSMEMPKEQWMRKYDCVDMWSRGEPVSYVGLRMGDKKVVDDKKIQSLEENIKRRIKEGKKNKYKIIEAPAGKCSWSEILMTLKKSNPTFKPDIVFVDYLGLFNLESDFGTKRHETLGHISTEIREYAKELNIPVVLIVQANRSSVQRVKGKREVQIDFENVEGSNRVSEDADAILALIPYQSDPYKIKIKVAKQRDGQKGEVDVKAFWDYCAFYDEKDDSFLNSNSDSENLYTGIDDDIGSYIDEKLGEDDEKEKNEEKDILRQINEVDDILEGNDITQELIDKEMNKENKKDDNLKVPDKKNLNKEDFDLLSDSVDGDDWNKNLI